MTTIEFINKELIFPNELLDGIFIFDNIKKYNFKENEEKRVKLNYHSDTFLLMIKYKLLLKDDTSFNQKELFKLCDYLCMDDIKSEFINFHDSKYLLDSF